MEMGTARRGTRRTLSVNSGACPGVGAADAGRFAAAAAFSLAEVVLGRATAAAFALVAALAGAFRRGVPAEARLPVEAAFFRVLFAVPLAVLFAVLLRVGIRRSGVRRSGSGNLRGGVGPRNGKAGGPKARDRPRRGPARYFARAVISSSAALSASSVELVTTEMIVSCGTLPKSVSE